MSGSRASPELRRVSAFTTDAHGGNPAGVWLGDPLPDPAEMQRIAADVGYSETAFVSPLGGRDRFRVRYFSPKAEVSFCGHATIATGVVLGERYGEGTFVLTTEVGDVPVAVERTGGRLVAWLTSVEPRHRPVDDILLNEVLGALGWERGELDAAIPPALAYAGAWHLVVAVSDAGTLNRLEYDFDRLESAMAHAGLTTLQLVWREHGALFHARNPFPVGGVIEDPATGAAAAALGGYLRDSGLMAAPAIFVIRQGEAMGRPSRLDVRVPEAGGVTVGGPAVALDGP